MRAIWITTAGLISTINLAHADCQFELRNAATTTSQIKRAVDIVNAAVRNTELTLKYEDAASGEPTSRDVPVYHIRPDPARPVVAEVPAGCRAIVVSGVNFERNFAALAKDNVLMQDKQVPMLTFLLLHEVGHIANRDYGAFLPDGNGPLNKDDTNAKSREDKADGYVAKILKREFDRLSSNDPPIENFDLYFGATDAVLFLSSLSFVISAQATINCFACRTLGSPQIFWDHGMSHPNFEYRLLLINNALAATVESQELVDRFEKGRDAAKSEISIPPESPSEQ